MTSAEFLLWVRGPVLQFAAVVFIIGVLLRLLEILSLGRKEELAATRSSGIKEGFKAMLTRSLPADKNTFRRSMFTLGTGYVFHFGLFVVIFLLAPHISFFKSILGFAWMSISTPVVDLFAVITMLALLATLYHRLSTPMLRHLSTPTDYLVWALTFIPVLTGYMAYHHLLLPYNWILGLHILSVAVLMMLFPFTKLMHAFTLFISRWYGGSIAGRRGVES